MTRLTSYQMKRRNKYKKLIYFTMLTPNAISLQFFPLIYEKRGAIYFRPGRHLGRGGGGATRGGSPADWSWRRSRRDCRSTACLSKVDTPVNGKSLHWKFRQTATTTPRKIIGNSGSENLQFLQNILKYLHIHVVLVGCIYLFMVDGLLTILGADRPRAARA